MSKTPRHIPFIKIKIKYYVTHSTKTTDLTAKTTEKSTFSISEITVKSILDMIDTLFFQINLNNVKPHGSIKPTIFADILTCYLADFALFMHTDCLCRIAVVLV